MTLVETPEQAAAAVDRCTVVASIHPERESVWDDLMYDRGWEWRRKQSAAGVYVDRCSPFDYAEGDRSSWFADAQYRRNWQHVAYLDHLNICYPCAFGGDCLL